MAKYIKSKFKVLWGTVFAFFYGFFVNDIVAQENDSAEESENQDSLHDRKDRQENAASLKSIQPSLNTGFRSTFSGEQTSGENCQQQSHTVSNPLPTTRVLGDNW